MFNWLFLAHLTDTKERQGCFKHLKNLKLLPNVHIYVYIFGPNVNSPIHRKLIDHENNVDLEPIMNYTSSSDNLYNNYTKVFNKIVQLLKHNHISIHGVNYYGHSSGMMLGHFDGARIFATTYDYVKLIIEPLKPIVVAFDSCYMGLVSTLYEISRVKSVKYVLASPSYHPSFSILETKSFGKIGTHKNLEKHLKQVSCEFQKLTYPSYRCFLIFDMKYIDPLVESLAKAKKNNKLVFDEKSVVSKDDFLYDLWKASKDKKLDALITSACKHGCGFNKCTLVKGMSIDIDLPTRHIPVYKKLRWYKRMQHLFYT